MEEKTAEEDLEALYQLLLLIDTEACYIHMIDSWLEDFLYYRDKCPYCGDGKPY